MFEPIGTGLPQCFSYRLRLYPDGACFHGFGPIGSYSRLSILDQDIAVQQLDYGELRTVLLKDGQILSN